MPSLQRVAPNSLSAWIALRPHLMKAIEKSEIFDEETVMRAYSDGGLELWVLLEDGNPFGAMATEIVQWPKIKVFIVHFLGTDAHTDDLWYDVLWPKLKDYAKSSGCVKIVVNGRPGWLRKLGGKPKFSTEVEL